MHVHCFHLLVYVVWGLGCQLYGFAAIRRSRDDDGVTIDDMGISRNLVDWYFQSLKHGGKVGTGKASAGVGVRAGVEAGAAGGGGVVGRVGRGGFLEVLCSEWWFACVIA